MNKTITTEEGNGITWTKEGSFLDQVRAVYIGVGGGIKFRIVESTINYCTITVDGRNMGAAVYGIDAAKKWCEDFEYCYDCGEYPTHADKLCHNCYFK